ncbi:MAG TPA: transcription termination/antitermination NusG family protein [Candidatus Acidoferrales bacterium]|nr:transcription termination/antitermination NusG family protein [Candidatus Acidoferrales bacterium]
MLVVSSYDAQWFAVQVKARAERNVASLLQAKGYEEFLPVTTARRAGRKCEIPLLPGYVFCRMNPNVQGLIVTTPGVIKIISFGGKPAPIDPEEIHSLQLIVKSNFPVVAHRPLQIGEKVRVEHGPLRGAVGVLLSMLHNKHRLVVCITMLMRAIAVEVDQDWVKPVEAEIPVVGPKMRVMRFREPEETAGMERAIGGC